MDDTKRSWKISAAVLSTTILMTFGSHYCFDAPSVMENQIQQDFNLNAKQYHSLFLMNSWSHMVMGLLSGPLIDRFGTAVMAVFFAVFFVIGQSIFALGASISQFELMLIGRSIYSLGSGPIQIVQTAICAQWFRHRGLGFSFGMVLTIGHLGSVLNFLITPIMATKYGAARTLWFADGLAMFSLLCTLAFFFIDRKYKCVIETQITKRIIEWRKLSKLNIGVWIIFFMTAAYYGVVFPFNSMSSKYLQVQYGYSLRSASWIAGSIYYMPFTFGPLFGLFVDKYGWRSMLGIIGFCLMIPALALVSFVHINPVAFFCLLGLTYAFLPAILWGSLPLLSDPELVGTVMGLNACFQMIGVGSNQMVIGALKDSYTYRSVFIDLEVLTAVGLIFSLLLQFTKGSLLNKKTKYAIELVTNEEKPSLIEEKQPLMSEGQTSQHGV